MVHVATWTRFGHFRSYCVITQKFGSVDDVAKRNDRLAKGQPAEIG
jgi:hypothetical protein